MERLDNPMNADETVPSRSYPADPTDDEPEENISAEEAEDDTDDDGAEETAGFAGADVDPDVTSNMPETVSSNTNAANIAAAATERSYPPKVFASTDQYAAQRDMGTKMERMENDIVVASGRTSSKPVVEKPEKKKKPEKVKKPVKKRKADKADGGRLTDGSQDGYGEDDFDIVERKKPGPKKGKKKRVRH